MRIGLWVLYVPLAVVTPCAVAQDVSRYGVPDSGCIEINQVVLKQLESALLENAGAALSTFLAARANSLDQSCAGLVLHNMAIVMARSGRLVEAEVYAQDS